MKTLNGAPQFVKYEPKLNSETVNAQLRKWAESRQCGKCALAMGNRAGTFVDDIICSRTNRPEYRTFSCAAFEAKL